MRIKSKPALKATGQYLKEHDKELYSVLKPLIGTFGCDMLEIEGKYEHELRQSLELRCNKNR